MALKIQLAVQGGGAKLCGLLAALEAVQKLEKAGMLNVTRLAGTSAGSIAAAMYAADIDFGLIRDRLRNNGATLAALFPQPSKGQLAWAAFTGRPIVKLGPLQDQLGKIFREVGVTEFRHLKRKLIVVTTDLTNGKTHRWENDENDVVNAIIDSCAIPFYFRGPSRPNDGILLVDGGICENLPADYLRQFEDVDGMAVGVTFKPSGPGKTPTSSLGFSRALLEAAMNNSVRRAQLYLGEDRLLSLDGDIDTFDFARAISEGMDKYRYEQTEASADRFFRALCDREKGKPRKIIVEPGPESEQSATTLQRVFDLYKAQHENTKMQCREARMIVRVGAISTDKETGRPGADDLSYRLRFGAAAEPLACTAIRVTESPEMEFLGTFRPEVFDAAGKPLRTIDLLGRSKNEPSLRLYLLFFDPIIRPNDPMAPYTLQYNHQIQGLMKPMAVDGKDVIAFRTHGSVGITPKVILIALIPESVPNVGIRTSADTTGSVKGRKMTDDELRLLDLPVGPAHYALGWVGENVEAGQMFAAELYQTGFIKQPILA
jgi:predicted acylesterase/phospholipase RssA